MPPFPCPPDTFSAPILPTLLINYWHDTLVCFTSFSKSLSCRGTLIINPTNLSQLPSRCSESFRRFFFFDMQRSQVRKMELEMGEIKQKSPACAATQHRQSPCPCMARLMSRAATYTCARKPQHDTCTASAAAASKVDNHLSAMFMFAPADRRYRTQSSLSAANAT
jgi:hypothetical protein